MSNAPSASGGRGRASALRRAGQLLAQGRGGEAGSLLSALLSRAVAEEDVLTEASARALLAQAALAEGRVEVAARHAERGIALARSLGDEEGEAFFVALLAAAPAQEAAPPTGPAPVAALLARARAALEDRDAQGAAALLTTALARARIDRDRPAEATAMGLLAAAQARLGRFAEALPLARDAFELALRHGSRDAVAHLRELADAIARRDPQPPLGPPFSVRIEVAAADASAGDLVGAARALRGLLAEAQAERARGPEASILFALAQIQLAEGDAVEAAATARAALQIAVLLDDAHAVERITRVLEAARR